MSLSRISLAPVVAAIGLVLLIGCKKEETPATDTATTAVTQTATTATATAGTTDTTGTAVAAHQYGPQSTKLNKEKFGTINDEEVKVTFGPHNEVTATPDPAEVNSVRPGRGKPPTITWIADLGVKLHVRVLRPATGPSCITGPELVPCTDNRCSAQTNPAIQKLPKTTFSIACKVKIWNDKMVEPADPEVVVDNCCP